MTDISEEEIRHTLRMALEADHEFGERRYIEEAVRRGYATYDARTELVTVTRSGRRFLEAGV